jgi:20S proteasome alpha/beta subunit
MYKFEPGSYQTPLGFTPALACYKITKKKEEIFDYILTNKKVVELTEQKAVESAEKSLNKAFQKRQKTGNDNDVAQSLKSDGFVKIDNPQFAKG